jgi:hypothetical protein
MFVVGFLGMGMFRILGMELVGMNMAMFIHISCAPQ